MTSNIFPTWTVVCTAAALVILVYPINTHAGWSGVLAEAQGKIKENSQRAQAQPCPGCDADVLPGSCAGQVSPEATAAGIRIPYGPGAYRYRDASGINKANRAIGRSMRNLNDSVRRMDNSINRIRNINRRF